MFFRVLCGREKLVCVFYGVLPCVHWRCKQVWEKKNSKECHHSGILSSSTHVNETANHAGWNHSPGGFSLRSIEATKFPCGDGSGRAGSTRAAILDDDVTAAAAAVWATLFSSRPSWMMTSQQQQRALFISCHFAFVRQWAQQLTMCCDRHFRWWNNNSKSAAAVPCSLNNILVDDVTATAGPR